MCYFSCYINCKKYLCCFCKRNQTIFWIFKWWYPCFIDLQVEITPLYLLFPGLASMSLYGGLVLFSGFLLYDTQRMVRRAEMHPQYSYTPFDPINA